jgi:aminoglycoside 6-adenylyltransferase
MDDARAAEVERLLAAFAAWAPHHPDVLAVALVGSWAREAAHEDSDVDVVVVSSTPEARVAAGDWPAGLTAAAVLRRRRWGVLIETRLGLRDGLEFEIGVVPERWTATAPPDAGTARVVRDGMRIYYDPHGRLAALDRAAAAERPVAGR